MSDKLKQIIKEKLSRNLDFYYDFDLRIDEENQYIFSMTHYYTWDIFLGKGKSIAEAINSSKIYINAYDSTNFKKFENWMNSLEKVNLDKVEIID